MRRAWLCVVLAVACDEVTGPPLAVCRATTQPLVLSVGAYTAIDPEPNDGCVIFPANASTTDSAEYLLVPQAITETPDLMGTFKLAGGAPLVAASRVAASYATAPLSPPERFHNLLRQLERTQAYPALPGAQASRPRAPSVARAALTLGDKRPFKVVSRLTRFDLDNVTGIVQSVGQHVVIYVDSAAPPGGLTQQDLDSIAAVFDTVLYPTDTSAFGRESDIDHNGLVIVLMTNVVNKLVSAADCQTSYVGGFFLYKDIDPISAYLFNNGEIFYTIVADSSGTLSCSHPNSQLKRAIPVTLVHEFQHMISFNQHALLRHTPAEVLWLNEALSHYAEERGGRSFLPSPDSATFCSFVRGDLVNAGQYLAATGSHALVDTSGIGGLPERGAGWLFVRYLVDRFAADTSLASADAFTRALELTTSTGISNVAQATGRPFAATARDWALSNWVSDLPGFAAPDSLRYKQWAFRTAFPRLNALCVPATNPATFPLAAAAGPGATISLTGTMASGSAGGYQRALQGPGDALFTLLFSDATGAQLRQTIVPRLNVLRIR